LSIFSLYLTLISNRISQQRVETKSNCQRDYNGVFGLI
jgi:hypothetical protein